MDIKLNKEFRTKLLYYGYRYEDISRYKYNPIYRTVYFIEKINGILSSNEEHVGFKFYVKIKNKNNIKPIEIIAHFD